MSPLNKVGVSTYIFHGELSHRVEAIVHDEGSVVGYSVNIHRLLKVLERA